DRREPGKAPRREVSEQIIDARADARNAGCQLLDDEEDEAEQREAEKERAEDVAAAERRAEGRERLRQARNRTVHPGWPAARNSSSARLTEAARTAARSPGKTWRSTEGAPPRRAQPIKTSPTGLVGVPPPGPAMPVTEMTISAREWARAPSAIAAATSSLT